MADELDLSGAVVVRNVGPQATPRNYSAIDAARGEGTGARREAMRTGSGPGSFGKMNATLGPVADEFAAGVSALTDYVFGQFSENPPRLRDLYGENLAIERQGQATYRENYPMSSTLAEVAGAGAIAPSASALMTAAGTARLGGAASRAAQAGPALREFARSAGTNVGLGAAAGGAAGFGEGAGGFQNRVETAAQGALLGGAVAGGVSLLAGGVQLVAAGLSRVRGLKGEGAERRARELLSEALQKDGITPDDIAALSQSGKPFTLADAGPNTRALLGSAVRHAGTGREAATDFLEGRALTQMDRVSGDLARLAGTTGNEFADTAEAIARRRAAAASTGYSAAYAAPAPALSDGAKAILETPSGKRAVKLAERALKDKRVDVFTDEGGNYTVQFLDQVQRKLRDMEGRSARSGAKEAARDFGRLREELLAELPDELKSVMRMYASESDLLEAMSTGRKFLLDKVDDIARPFAAMSPHEQAMYRLGVARALREKMGAKIDSGDITGLFQNPNMREKLRAVFPDEFALQDFLMATRTERIMQDTRNAVLKGSPTASRLADDDTFTSGALGEAAADVVRGGGSTTSVTGAVLNAGLAAMRDAKDRILQGLAEEVGDRIVALTTTPNLGRTGTAVSTRLAPPPVPYNPAARVTAGAAPVAAYPAAMAATSQPPRDPAPLPDLGGAVIIRR